MQELVSLLGVLYVERSRGNDVAALIAKAELAIDAVLSSALGDYEASKA